MALLQRQRVCRATPVESVDPVAGGKSSTIAGERLA
jgi:hypothetical protein